MQYVVLRDDLDLLLNTSLTGAAGFSAAQVEPLKWSTERLLSLCLIRLPCPAHAHSLFA